METQTTNHSAPTKDVERLLQEDQPVQLHVRGYSMYPYIIPGEDWVIIEPASSGKKGDILLFRREGEIPDLPQGTFIYSETPGLLVLHRVIKVTPEGFYFLGDNQQKVQIEGPISPSQIRGKMTRRIRKGKETSTDSFESKLYSSLWCMLLPIRRFLQLSIHRLKNIGK